MKWDEIKSFFEDLRQRPFRTLLMFILLLISVYLIAMATNAGKADGEGGFMGWVSEIFSDAPQPDCDTLRQTDLQIWIAQC